MRLVSRALLAVLVAIAASGCGSEDRAGTVATTAPQTTADVATSATDPDPSDTDADSTESGTPPDSTASPDDLDQYLLTLDDMPSGWTVSPDDEEDESDDASTSEPPECSSDLNAFESAEEASIQFQQSELGPFVFQGVTRFDDVADAEEAFQAFVDQVNRCQSFTETDADGTVINYTFAPLSFDEYGDETFAAVLRADSDIFPLEANLIFFRDGEYVGGVGALGIGAAPQVDLDELVSTAASKLP